VTTSIGTLIVEATKRAKAKKNGHTATAPCGCSVTITFFSTHSSTMRIDRCADHPKGT
jgi:hypothetical protein